MVRGRNAWEPSRAEHFVVCSFCVFFLLILVHTQLCSGPPNSESTPGGSCLFFLFYLLLFLDLVVLRLLPVLHSAITPGGFRVPYGIEPGLAACRANALLPSSLCYHSGSQLLESLGISWVVSWSAHGSALCKESALPPHCLLSAVPNWAVLTSDSDFS